MPGEKGDVRNLTNSVGAHERFPAWSPDGRSIAWFSDEGGEYQLYIGSQDGKGEPRAIKVAGEGFYNAPVWSPDSQKIAYFDNSQSVYWLDVKSGVSKKIASQPIYGPVVDHQLRLVAGLEVARLRDGQPGAASRRCTSTRPSRASRSRSATA